MRLVTIDNEMVITSEANWVAFNFGSLVSLLPSERGRNIWDDLKENLYADHAGGEWCIKKSTFLYICLQGKMKYNNQALIQPEKTATVVLESIDDSRKSRVFMYHGILTINPWFFAGDSHSHRGWSGGCIGAGLHYTWVTNHARL